MKKTFTNFEIYTMAKQLTENFQDNNQYLPIKVNFFMQKNKKLILDLAQGISDSRLDIIKHYGSITEDGQGVNIPNEKIPEANKEIDDLFNLVQELDIAMVKIESFPEDISLTTGQMEALMFMIEEL